MGSERFLEEDHSSETINENIQSLLSWKPSEKELVIREKMAKFKSSALKPKSFGNDDSDSD